jgi:3-oxoacyl-[acyl-carrier-protein] synthase-3
MEERMQFNHVMIESVEYILGPHRVTSTDLEEQFSETLTRLGVRPGLLEAISGIRERRFWDFGTQPSEVATMAARKAIEIAGIDPQEIGCMTNTSVMKDYIEPSVASLVHGNLKLSPNCINYDIGNACLGFVNGIFNVGLMIEAKLIKYGLVVAGEAGRELIEATIRQLQKSDVTKEDLMANLATLTLGEGAVAMVLSHQDVSRTGHSINGAVSMAATEYNRLCVAKPDFMKANPGKLMTAGVRLAAKTWKLASKTLENWNNDQIDLYTPHQVSSHNTTAFIKAIGSTKSKFKLTFPMLGNTASVGLPTALAMAAEEGRLENGNHVGLIGIGSGLNCMMMSVNW